MELVANDREIGELSGRMAAVERTAERLEHKLDANSSATQAILSKISGLEGGWRVVLLVSTGAAALGGLLVKFLPVGLHL